MGMAMLQRMVRGRAKAARVTTQGRLALQAAGWTAVAFGAAHVVVAPLQDRTTWSQVLAEGGWDTFTLDEPSTSAELERSRAFWVSMGSFGVPMLALGSYLVWSVRQGHQVPGWLGALMIAWGVPLVIVLPKAPGWAIPLMGGLIALGNRRRAGASTAAAG